MMVLIAMYFMANASATPFIKDVMLIGGSKGGDKSELDGLKNSLVADGWTFIDYDLNKGGYGCYIFMLYKAEEHSDGANWGYITDFYMTNQSGTMPETLTHNGRTYHLVPYDGMYDFTNKQGNLNAGTGKVGDDIHLYYTKDFFPDNYAISTIWFTQWKDEPVVHLNGGSTLGDFNLGCTGYEDIFLHYSTKSTSRHRSPHLSIENYSPLLTSFFLSGFVYDPDAPVLPMTVRVEVIHSDGTVYKTLDLPADELRESTNSSLGIIGNHGFSATINVEDVPVGDYTVRITANDLTGDAATITEEPLTITRGAVDLVEVMSNGDIHVKGWAYDPSNISASCSVYVMVDDPIVSWSSVSKDLTTDVLREDINRAYGLTGNHGFDAILPIRASGEHTIRFYEYVGEFSGKKLTQFGPETTVSCTRVVTLNSSTGSVRLFRGDILTGKGGPDTRIIITGQGCKYSPNFNITRRGDITMRDVTLNIPFDTHTTAKEWTCINCDGDAFINLEGTNSVQTGFASAAIRPGDAGSTLTIGGSGTLYVKSMQGAAIGTGSYESCGNIVIEGGTITADGGDFSAGIGSGKSGTCGNITISGGTVEAIAGCDGAGIGSGKSGTCGNIALTGGIITVSKGGAPYNIGPGLSGTCGTFHIGSWSVDYIEESPFVCEPQNYDPRVVEITPETESVVLTDGQILTGTDGPNTNISIEDNATVTLRGVTRNSGSTGIICKGNATIILADGTTNIVSVTVSAFGGQGIWVAPGKTLTIRGSGTLYASSCNSAGIGNGNVIIEGGTVTAVGSSDCAGIGCVQKIGNCGNITITDAVTSVTAIAGSSSKYSIGSAKEFGANVGTITIGGVVTGAIMKSPFIYNPSDKTTYTVTFNANGGKGSMDKQTFIASTAKALNACTFTLEGYEFDGWNTAPDGSGTIFADGQTVIGLGNTTFYAQWREIGSVRLTQETTTVTLHDGEKLTGTGGTYARAVIEAGATVTLCDVDLTDVELRSTIAAAILCKGDATIFLEGTNSVKGDQGCPGIYVPEGSTLTIKGSGSLTSSTIEVNPAASIGCGYHYPNCGNIVIEGGTIVANVNEGGCGIGSCQNKSCGNITIKGGTVYATGSREAAGIGCTNGGSCGNITISGGTVNATGGYGSSGIGCGYNSCSCGTITITGGANRVCATSGLRGGSPIGSGGYKGSVTGVSIYDGFADVTRGSTRTLSHDHGTLANASDWNHLAIDIANGWSNEGQTITMTGNFTATTMLSNFSGTFDGGGHTLTLNLDAETSCVAPFSTIQNATIRDLIVEGNVSGARHSSGLVGGTVGGTNLIENCVINANITCSEAYCGGIVGHGGNSANYTLRGCVFDGSFGGNASTVGTLWGWSDAGTTLAISDCIDLSSTTHCIGNGAGTITVQNTYYTNPTKLTVGTRYWSAELQGTRAYSSATLPVNIGDAIKNYGYVVSYTSGLGYDERYYNQWASNPQPVMITFCKEGYSTYYDSQYDMTLTAGMKARIITAKAGGNTLTYQTIADGDLIDVATDVVPAGTAVLLQVAPTDGAQTIKLTMTAPTAAAIGQDNLLYGSDEATTTTGGNQFYKLSYNRDGDDKTIGWYWGAQDAGAFTSGAHKAWLALLSFGQLAPLRSIGLPDFNEGTTDVIIIPYQPVQAIDVWYDIYGRKFYEQPSTSGLYIHNGKTIMIIE